MPVGFLAFEDCVMEIETDVRGFDTLLIRMRAIEEQMQEDMKDGIQDAANVAYRVMLNRVPRDSGRLAGSIVLGSPSGGTGIRFVPGGAGGGGYFETQVTAGEGVPYANVVLEGSGIFGPQAHPITASNGNIRTKRRPEWRTTTGASYMYFRPKGVAHLIRKKSVAGQHAQTLWLDEAQAAARAVIETKAAEMGHKRYL